MKRRIASLLLTVLIMAMTADAQAKPTITNSPQIDLSKLAALKTRFWDGTKEPLVKMQYDLRYNIVQNGEDSIQRVKSAIKSFKFKHIVDYNPSKHGSAWEITLDGDTPESQAEADRFVLTVAQTLGQSGTEIVELSKRMELFDMFYSSPGVKLLAGRKVTFIGQNEMGFMPREGDHQRLRQLLESSPMFIAASVLPDTEVTLIVKGNAFTWHEVITKLESILPTTPHHVGVLNWPERQRPVWRPRHR